MKELFRNSIILVLLFVSVLAGCREKKTDQAATRYTCPMHPQVVTEEPGTCPICKMDLVPVDGTSGHDADDSLAYLVKPTNQVVISGIRTVRPSRGNRYGKESLKGVISYDPENINSISSRVNGRIERLFVYYNFQRITKGQKLMEIYSPDLAAAQTELLFLQSNGDMRLLEAARQKLRLLGMSQEQIGRILRTGQVDYRVTLYSPYSGYLMTEPAVEPVSGGTAKTVISGSSGSSGSMEGGSMAGMSGSTAAAPSVPTPAVTPETPLLLREGQYVTAGQKLLSLVDPRMVRAEFYVSPESVSRFERGTPVRVAAVDDPGLVAESRVSLVQPFYSEGASFSKVRAQISNPSGKWKVGQLITVEKETGGTPGTWLPRTAVLQTGSRYVTFVRKPFGFVPVYVNVSEVLGDWADIGDSLPADAEVAENGWFLVDSESFIKVDSLKQ